MKPKHELFYEFLVQQGILFQILEYLGAVPFKEFCRITLLKDLVTYSVDIDQYRTNWKYWEEINRKWHRYYKAYYNIENG